MKGTRMSRLYIYITIFGKWNMSVARAWHAVRGKPKEWPEKLASEAAVFMEVFAIKLPKNVNPI